jgi:phosphoglycolate phosphatase
MARNTNLLRGMLAPILVFDLDGTLADTAPDLLASLRAVLTRYGFTADPDPALRDGIGHGARHLIEYALRQQQVSPGTATVDAMHRDFLAYYEENICAETQAYPGVDRLLDRFADCGWKFAVCTNKPESYSRLLLDQLGLLPRFAAICGGDTFATRKPHPAHLFGTILAGGGVPDGAVMVGDSRTDLDTARGAGIPFVGVSFGYTPVPMAELGPDILLDSYDELTVCAAQELVSGSERATAKITAPARTLDFADPRTYSIGIPAGQGA